MSHASRPGQATTMIVGSIGHGGAAESGKEDNYLAVDPNPTSNSTLS
ncbi:hypothetical protein [Aureliella helgolandensis]|nr:hypothetical protein [Aureliella helgolandensis]